jgi:hypothetical protein
MSRPEPVPHDPARTRLCLCYDHTPSPQHGLDLLLHTRTTPAFSSKNEASKQALTHAYPMQASCNDTAVSSHGRLRELANRTRSAYADLWKNQVIRTRFVVTLGRRALSCFECDPLR